MAGSHGILIWTPVRGRTVVKPFTPKTIVITAAQGVRASVVVVTTG
jgi:hypothetical protein